jgi:hypothetical protein
MVAPSLNLFQFFISLGIYFYSGLLSYLVLSVLFGVLYLVLFMLRKRLSLGKSSAYNLLKRLDKKIFTGGLLAAYLTGSGCIAILFLVVYRNFDSQFWRFQIVFLFVFNFSIFLFNTKKNVRAGDFYVRIFTKRFYRENERYFANAKKGD